MSKTMTRYLDMHKFEILYFSLLNCIKANRESFAFYNCQHTPILNENCDYYYLLY